MEHRFAFAPRSLMCSSDEKQSRSPLALYSEYQRMDIELRPPHAMPTSHWHGQVEVNVPFDGDVEYLINNEVVRIKRLYHPVLGLYAASADPPRRLPADGDLQPADASVSLMAAGPGADQPRHPRDGD
jgi:hypothetical protein